MDLIPAIINWNRTKSIHLPHLTLEAANRLQGSGIGMVFKKGCPACCNMCFLVLDDQTDLATMHAILGGDDDEWKGTTDDQLLLRALTGYIESHPKQELFCFVAINF